MNVNLIAGASRRRPAFFKISRSSWRIRFSRRSRASSSRSAVVRPVFPLVRSARARFTHSRSAVSVRSRSRATLPTLLPSSSTSRTAWALKSSSNRRARPGAWVCLPSVWTSYPPQERCPRNRIKPRSRYREIILPKPKDREWVAKVSESFRSYFTTIAAAKTAFIESVQKDRFEHVANVATVLRLAEESIEEG